MTLTINGYEIEIKAKNTLISTRYNKEDTCAFLNKVSSIASVAAEEYEKEGYEKLEAAANKMSWTIYKALKEAGYYNN